jgi:toxin CptA
VIGAVLILAVLATVSLLTSEMPRLAAWSLVIVVVVHTGFLVRRYQCLPRKEFVFPGNDLAVVLDGQSIDDVAVEWRGPLAFIRWRDRTGRQQRLSWWPDTLPPASRRELRLAAGHLDAVRHPSGVAP